MTISTLDPNPKNQLGKDILAPELERQLLADGYVFACLHPATKGKRFVSLTMCKRLWSDAVTDSELDDPNVPLHFRPTVPSPVPVP